MILDKDQDLRKLFHDPQLPDVDLTGKVMTKLYAEKKKKERFFLKYKVSLLVVVGMLLTVSSGFAMVKYLSLENKQGEVVHQIKPLKEAPDPNYQEEDGKRMGMSNKLGQELLQDGSAAIFYIVPHNPTKQTDTRFKPVVFTDLSALRTKMTGKSITIVDSLKENYKFESALVFFEPVTFVNRPTPEEEAATAEMLRKQAEESKKEYAMMPVDLSDKFLHIQTIYKQGENEISVTIINYGGGKYIPTSYWDEKLKFKQEKIVVKGVEMLYTENTEGVSKDIRWIYEIPGSGHKYGYNIKSSAKEINKEELIKIAETYQK
ncbi:MAG TPA: hypothetical protein VGI33_03125 [Paenibacillus sp.]|jgi:hypothetical protein